MDVMRSVLGMVVLLTIAFLLSVNKKKISLRTVGAALVLQVVIGGIMLWLPPGRWVAEKVAFGVHKVMAYSDAGSAFIFGSLVGPKMDTLFDGAGFIFGFRVALWMLKPWRLFLSRCAVSLTLVLSGWWWGRFLRLRHTVRRKSPNLVYARWRRRHFPI
jgi:nucleoside permease NupC